MTLTFIRGDATSPHGAGPKIIAHVCNDLGRWGKGFVLAVSKRWPQPEAEYRAWAASDAGGFALGAIQLVEVSPRLWVANMVGQHGLRGTPKRPPIRYDAVERCLEQLGEKARELGASVHMPRIGCGLAGGKWEEIEPIVRRTLVDRGVSVVVYDLG